MSTEYAVRLEWGSWSRYDPRADQHANYRWDGCASAEGGSIDGASIICFEGIWGAQSESHHPLAGPSWRWRPDNNAELLGGVLLRVIDDSDTRIHLRTQTITVVFRLGDLLEQGSLRWHVGQRYSGVNVTALIDGLDPNLDRPRDLEEMSKRDGRWRARVDACAFGAPLRRWFRADWAWIAPRTSAEAQLPEPTWDDGAACPRQAIEATIHAIAAVPRDPAAKPEDVPDCETDTTWIPYRVALNGRDTAHGNQHFGATRWLGRHLPYKEEVTLTLPRESFRPSRNTLRIHNDSPTAYLLVARVVLERVPLPDFEVSVCPAWVLRDVPFEIALTCRAPQRDVQARLPAGFALVDPLPRELAVGEHRMHLLSREPRANVVLRFESASSACSAPIDQVWAAKPEPFPMRVGVEENCFPATDPTLEERILRELKDKQLGDFIKIRREDCPSQDRLLEWVRSARAKGIYHQISMSIGGHWRTRDDIGPVWGAAGWREAGEYGLGFEWTEHDGPLWNYLVNPRLIHLSVPETERTMRTACEDYHAYLGRMVRTCRETGPDMPSWLLLSTLGHAHGYRMGMQGCVAQMNKSHNALLLADARGASREFDRPLWGTYIAEGAHMNPEGEEHLRMWQLALNLSYVCGASFTSDEECLLRSWHSHQYSWTDRFPRLRQEILRRFNRYVKTHPRTGRLRARQALLTGRYACDVVDGFANSDGPWVWCNFGARSPEWKPTTPEYGLRYLDVFLPGVWLQSLEQSPARTRRLYSGTPYGEIEVVSVEAPVSVLSFHAPRAPSGTKPRRLLGSEGGYDLKLHGHGRRRVRLNTPAGRSARRLRFTGPGCRAEVSAAWIDVDLDFGELTTGRLEVR